MCLLGNSDSVCTWSVSLLRREFGSTAEERDNRIRSCVSEQTKASNYNYTGQINERFKVQRPALLHRDLCMATVYHVAVDTGSAVKAAQFARQ